LLVQRPHHQLLRLQLACRVPQWDCTSPPRWSLRGATARTAACCYLQHSNTACTQAGGRTVRLGCERLMQQAWKRICCSVPTAAAAAAGACSNSASGEADQPAASPGGLQWPLQQGGVDRPPPGRAPSTHLGAWIGITARRCCSGPSVVRAPSAAEVHYHCIAAAGARVALLKLQPPECLYVAAGSNSAALCRACAGHTWLRCAQAKELRLSFTTGECASLIECAVWAKQQQPRRLCAPSPAEPASQLGVTAAS
jgi:hypothetical protein